MTDAVKEPMQAYVDTLMERAGFASLPADLRQEYSDKIVIEANRRVGLTLLPLLNETSLKAFQKLMASSDATPAEAMTFFEKNIPDFQSKVQLALEEFAGEFLASATNLRSQAQ